MKTEFISPRPSPQSGEGESAHDNSMGAAPHPACGSPHPSLRATLSHPMGEGHLPGAEKDRLPVQVVEHLHRLLGGDARVEAMVLDYVEYRWQHRDLFRIPPNVASQIIRRPGDFLKAVKQHCEPELFAEGHQF